MGDEIDLSVGHEFLDFLHDAYSRADLYYASPPARTKAARRWHVVTFDQYCDLCRAMDEQPEAMKGYRVAHRDLT